MDFIDKIGAFLSNAFHSLGAITDRLDTNSWVIISIVAVVGGLLFIKGDAIKGA